MPGTVLDYRYRAFPSRPDCTRSPARVVRASTSSCARHRSNRLQNRLMHLFRVDAQSGGVGFQDRDSPDEVLAAQALLVQFLSERTNLVLEIILLDSSTAT